MYARGESEQRHEDAAELERTPDTEQPDAVHLLALQKTAGNQAVARYLSGQRARGTPVQRASGPVIQRSLLGTLYAYARSGWDSLTAWLASLGTPAVAAPPVAVAGPPDAAVAAQPVAPVAQPAPPAADPGPAPLAVDPAMLTIATNLLPVYKNVAERLANHIQLAGGEQQLPKIERLLNLSLPANPFKLNALLSVANGNASEFDRLYEACLKFHNKQPLTPRPPSNRAATYGYPGGAFLKHVIERHTFEWFNPTLVDDLQTFFPAGTSMDQIRDWLDEALDLLHAPGGAHPHPYHAQDPGDFPPPVALGNGMTVQVGIGWGPGKPAQKVVGQFYALPGPGITSLTRRDMTAIHDVLGLGG
jgi:hypothetical protein